MPAVQIAYPMGLFDGNADKGHFIRSTRQIVASHMDAIDPKKKVMTKFGESPETSIDLLLVPYDPGDAALTTPLLGTIVTYKWKDRMRNLDARMEAITKEVRELLRLQYPDGEAISFTFLGKQKGAWFVA